MIAHNQGAFNISGAHPPNSGPCPKCGGKDRFNYIPSLRVLNGAPGWWCRNPDCRYLLPLDAKAPPSAPPPALTEEQIALIHRANEAVVTYCVSLLWSNVGHNALSHLRARGFSDETIHQRRYGYHGKNGVGLYLWRNDRQAYQGAILAGLLNKSGKESKVLQNTIIIPYLADGKVVMIRGRALDASAKAKYLSPTGVGLYAGATPSLYGGHILSEIRRFPNPSVILTEGEFKAEAATQAWMANQLSMPAVAQPGLWYLPDSFMEQLAGLTVYLAYDVEQRKEPFALSPGERGTIQHGRKLVGVDVAAQIRRLEEKGETMPDEEQVRLEQLKARYEWGRRFKKAKSYQKSVYNLKLNSLPF